MYYGYGMDYAYLGIIILSIVLGGITQSYINSQYKKWSRVPASMGKTGAQVARAMLDSSGASSVGIGAVASVAVACHEAGHAVQTAKGYAFGRFRTALVPVVNFTSRTWAIVLVIGMVLGIAGLTQLAVAFFAFSVLFQLVTLPVEIDASRRAVRYLSTAGGGIDEHGARQVLTAAALTYVAAALISVLQLLYLLGRTGDRN